MSAHHLMYGHMCHENNNKIKIHPKGMAFEKTSVCPDRRHFIKLSEIETKKVFETHSDQKYIWKPDSFLSV